jgi:hypothetical protein
MAEIYSIDLDATTGIGGGLGYGISQLVGTVVHRVVEADNATLGGNVIQFEDIFPNGSNVSHNYIIPVVYKNYGGGVHRWDSIISACLTRGVLNPQPVVFQFYPLTRGGGPYNVTRNANAGGCVMLNLRTLDPDDPDFIDTLASLPTETAFSVAVTSTGGLFFPAVNTTFFPPDRPSGFFAHAVSYSRTGKMATLHNGSVALDLESSPTGTTPGGFIGRELYGPLLFKNYNGWNSAFSLVNFRFAFAGGGGSTGFAMTFYGEDGTVFGTYLDRLSTESARVYYLPALPIQLPDGFRGSVVITAGDVANSSRFGMGAMHVNYDRTQAISYSFTRQDQLLGVDSPYTRPCNQTVFAPFAIAPQFGAATYTSCLTVADAQRRFAPVSSTIAPFEITGNGPTTGIRLFNPDVTRTGTPAFVLATHTDASGVYYTDSPTTITIPALGTATIFLGADARLPDTWDGTVFIQSTKEIVGPMYQLNTLRLMRWKFSVRFIGLKSISPSVSPSTSTSWLTSR